MTLTVECVVEDDGWSSLPNVVELVERAIAAAARAVAAPSAQDAEVCVLLCGDAAIRDLNSRWRHVDKPTNVLSFPAAAGDAQVPLLGDIAIAYGTTAREAAEEGKPVADHVAHLAVHGFLHLLGHDHPEPASAFAMEALEIRILAELGIADPYAGSVPEDAL